MVYFKMLKKGDPLTQAIDLKVMLGASSDPQLNNETIDFDGVNGSTTVHQGASGGKNNFKVVFRFKEDVNALNNFKKLENWYLNGTEVTILYASTETYTNIVFGGNFKIISVNIEEPKRGKYEVDLEIQKQTVFPPPPKSLTSFAVASKSTSNSALAVKGKPLLVALDKCKLPLSRSPAGVIKSSNCNLTWQKILRLFNFYINYKGKTLLLDGLFGLYAEDATKKFQKKYKIKVTGKCDAATVKKVKSLLGYNKAIKADPLKTPIDMTLSQKK